MTLSRNFILAEAHKKLKAKQGFCLARFPGEEDLKVYHNPVKQHDVAEDCFLVQGWNKSEDRFYYTSVNEKASDFTDRNNEVASKNPQRETSFESYSEQFEIFQEAFSKTVVKKAILSRLKHILLGADFDPITYFERLEKAYPNALVYLMLHPTEGLWIGASPEILITGKNGSWTTVSLAGTQKISSKDYKWGEKEIEEQEYVSAHIRETLSEMGVNNFLENGPQTAEAASVAHLKTIFKFNASAADFNYLKYVDRVHPTPAISGTPLKESIALINDTEIHNRKLYTGYLGRAGEETIDLYVNLRCSQVFSDKMVLYLGGGITKGSNLKLEWEETEEKAKTLLKQIHE